MLNLYRYYVYSRFVPKDKSYHKRKNHENYELDKIISKSYKNDGIHGESYSDYKRKWKEAFKG